MLIKFVVNASLPLYYVIKVECRNNAVQYIHDITFTTAGTGAKYKFKFEPT